MERTQVQIPAAQLDRQRDFEAKLKEMHAARPLRALVDTFGCQQNVADSQHIMGMLEAMGCSFTDDPAQADVVVLNTCAIRDHAEKRVYGNLGALTHTKKANPAQVICLCGCMAQRPEVAEKVRQSYRHVDLVFGPQALWKFPELLYQVYTQRRRVFSVEDEHGAIAEGMPVVREGRTRAWVSIMYGCNNFCSYCIVPYVRGRERSRDPERIIDEVRGLVADGFKEITLLGQNVNAFGRDTHGDGVSFAALLEKVAALPGLKRLRYVTPHPKDMGPEDVAAFANIPQLCPRLHLPLQAGSDAVLKRMGRKYDSARYLELVASLRDARPDIALSTDLIVGFPGETEEDFAATLELMRASDFMSSFSFCYSDRPGTRASRFLDKIAPDVQQDRLLRLQALQEELSQRWLDARVGQECEVLLENASRREATDDSLQSWQGRDIYGALVHVPLPAGDHTGRLVNARIVEAKKHSLVAEATGQPW